jgi:hypothetical protein
VLPTLNHNLGREWNLGGKIGFILLYGAMLFGWSKGWAGALNVVVVLLLPIHITFLRALNGTSKLTVVA